MVVSTGFSVKTMTQHVDHFGRPLGNLRDLRTTLGEILSYSEPHPSHVASSSSNVLSLGSPWLAVFSSSTIFSLSVTRLLWWPSPILWICLGILCIPFLHMTCFPFPIPTTPHASIWWIYVSHLGGTHCKAKSRTVSCLHIHRETLMPQMLKATGFHHSPFPKADFSPGVWARRNATCQYFVMHLMVPLSNPECSLHLSYVPVSSAPRKVSFCSPIPC